MPETTKGSVPNIEEARMKSDAAHTASELEARGIVLSENTIDYAKTCTLEQLDELILSFSGVPNRDADQIQLLEKVEGIRKDRRSSENTHDIKKAA